MSAAMIKFGKKNKRQIALFSILVIMFVVAAYFHILFRPAVNKLSTLLPKVSMLKREVVDARSLMANRDTIEKEKETLQLKIDIYQKIFPSQHEIPRILENLSNIAGESDVRIIGIKPLTKEGAGPEGESKIYQEIPIEIVARSGYHQLGQFLQKLESGDRFIMIKDIKISSNPHNMTKHNVKLIASTYILVEK